MMSVLPVSVRYRWGLLLLCLALAARATAAEPHACGARALTPEEQAYLADRIVTVQRSKAALPSSVRNTAHLPVVGNQGWIGSCSAFAACYYLKTYQEARERGWMRPDPAVNPERVASPAFCFIVNQQLPSYSGAVGISYWTAADSMVDFGVVSWAEMPYSEGADFTVWPGEQAWRQALPWRARQAGAIRALDTPAGLDTLKEHLAGGDVAVISFMVYTGFDDYPSGDGSSNDVFYRNTGAKRDGHAVCVVGYDDTLTYTDATTQTTRQGAFLFVNSWGGWWGVNEPSVSPDGSSRGFGWMAYDYFLAGKVDREAMVMVDRVGYTPTRLACVGINHPTGGILDLEVLGGDRDHPQWRRRVLPRGNPRPLNLRFPVDLTDVPDLCPLAYWLRVTDPNAMGLWPATGTITDFTIETLGQEPLSSPDAPLQTVKNWVQYLRLGVFSESGLDLAGLHIRDGSAAWGDYDNDGFPDLALTGLHFPAAGTGATATTRLLHNQGGTAFTDSGATLLPTSLGTVAWGDLDNDGRLDLLVSDPTAGTRVYRNTGSGFMDCGISLPGSTRTGVAWGDLDNDGRQDLAIATAWSIHLQRNTGTGFEPLEQVLEGPAEASLSWGDANGDGYLDLLVVSRAELYSPFTRLYLNRGDDTFAAAESGLPALNQGTAAWGDVDADGRLDLALQGAAGSAQTGLFRSLGTGRFTPAGSPLPGLQAGALHWGDLDADGLLDLLLTGREGNFYGLTQGYPNCSRLFRATPEGFVDGYASLRDVSSGFAGLADLDRDGDLDVLLGGTTNAIYESVPTKLYNGIFTSALGQPSACARANTPPLPPTGLVATAAAEPGTVILAWNAGSDAETPAAGLRYSVRVGTAAGAGDVLSAALPVSALGLLRCSGLPLRRLAPGTYHWAVRSVDNGFAVSAWSAPASLTVPAHTPLRQLTLATEPPTWGTTVPVPGTHALPRDSVVPIRAVASPGYRFVAWHGAVADPTAVATSVPLHDNRAATAEFAVKYDLSPLWTQHTPAAPWGERYMHQALAFHGQLWILGGTGQPQRHDVWSSPNGQTWTQQTAAAAWSGRYGHAAVVFRDRLWVFGGYDVMARNDVWSSADGSTWRLESENAPWAARLLHQVVGFNGELWLTGGYSSADGTLADVWRSADGVTWTQITATAAWPARYSHGALAFAGRLWILGGSNFMGMPGNDVWSSADGATWTQDTEHADWPPRSSHGVAVLADRMWVLGGSGEGVANTDDVWFSRNGATWTRAGTASGWAPRSGHAVVVLNDRLWVLGGNGAGLLADVWSGLPGTSVPGLASLFVDVDPADAGTTTPSIGEHVEAVGTVFAVSAAAQPGFRFVAWTGPVANPAAATTTVTLAAERTVTARFEAVPRPMATLLVSVSPVGGGSTTPPVGAATYPVGTVIPLAATPAHGYLFAGWSGGVADPAAALTVITLDSAKTVTARFAADGFVRTMPLAAGSEHSVALKTEGSAWSWGQNDSGQLGNGKTDDATAPYPLRILGDVTALAGGAQHTLALLRDGSVRAWGRNDENQLGEGMAHPCTAPVAVAGLPTIVAIACGAAYSLALAADGTVWTWGSNTDGILGCGLDSRYYPTVARPVQVPGPYGVSVLRGIVQIAAGSDHALALRADGTLWAWGRNTWGQLGTGDGDPTDYPLAVPGLAEVRLIACGGDAMYGGHSLAVDASGTLWAWGANRSGQLGDGSTTERSSPVMIPAAGDVIGIAAGARFSLALRSDGTLCAWGDNTYGQLGDGSHDNRATPAPVPGLTAVAGMAAGPRHALAVLADGSLRAWGRNAAGMLGDGTQSDRAAPVLVAGINLQVASRGLNLALLPSPSAALDPLPGSYRCLENALVPLLATGNARYAFSHWTGAVTASTAAQSSAIMSADQTVTAHFDLLPGVQAQLTLAAAPPEGGATIPPLGTQSVEVGTVVNLSARAGYRHRFTAWTGSVAVADAMDTSTTVVADQTVTANFAPTPFTTSAVLACGTRNTFLVRSDSTVLATGQNRSGELGRGVGQLRWPGPVLGADGSGELSGVIGLAAGTYHTVALRYDGSLWSWGSNQSGQLGDGMGAADHPGRFTPAPVLGPAGGTPLRGIRKVSAGLDFSVALVDNGTLLAWGANREGQLGDGTTTVRTLPTPVRGPDGVGLLTDVVDLVCGSQYTLARRADGTWWGWGANTSNALCNPVSPRSLTPVLMQLPVDIERIACGSSHTLARRADGTLLAWGTNYYGELGDGSTVASLTPVAVTGLSAVTQIAAGRAFSVALRSDGTVWTWGWNRQGYLGNNGTEPSPLPVQVLGQGGIGLLTGIVSIACGLEHVTALRADGSAFGWGSGEYYELSYSAGLWNLVPIYIVMASPAVAVTTHVLRIGASPAVGGATLPTASSHTYDHGDVVDLEARPSPGWRFVTWTGNAAQKGACRTTITMAADETVTAFFECETATPGDVNLDGVVNNTDASLCLAMAVHRNVVLASLTRPHPYPVANRTRADLDGDGAISAADAEAIMRRVMGLEGPVPDPYLIRPVAPPETHPEEVVGHTVPGEATTVALSDGTAVEIPALDGTAEIHLARQTNTLSLADYGLQASGSRRTLTLTFATGVSEEDRWRLRPIITIPYTEIGGLNADTINLARVSERWIDGELTRRVFFLPVSRDGRGNLVTRDPYPAGDVAPLTGVTGKGGTRAPATLSFTYLPGTFQGTIDWATAARLVRMVPERTQASKRRPLTALSPAEQAVEMTKPVQNVVVLVHGHNEGEQAGLPGTFSPDDVEPWGMSYKRQVWDRVYEIFLEDHPELLRCTVFYEFIYPTWRTVFGHLDQALSTSLEDALQVQLAQNLKPNLFVVAHSMGGLVSRAGLQMLSATLDPQFRQLVTWGSPHHGAEMSSFRYAMCSPYYELNFLPTWMHWLAARVFETHLVLDTPGARDLRWCNGPAESPRYTTIGTYFFNYYYTRIALDYGLTFPDAELNLRTGSHIYNPNLRLLNTADTKGDRLTCLYGVTEAGLRDDMFSGGILESAFSVTGMQDYSQIAIGASINAVLTENGLANRIDGVAECRSDGASPLISEIALGVAARRVNLGNIDHEEYYNLGGKARYTATRTFEALGIGVDPAYNSPKITFLRPTASQPLDPDEDGTFTIEARLDWPGDPFPGRRVKDQRVDLIVYDRVTDLSNGFGAVGRAIRWEDIIVTDTGQMSGSFLLPGAEGVYAAQLVYHLKDDTEVHGIMAIASRSEFQTTRNGTTLRWSITQAASVRYMEAVNSYTTWYTALFPPDSAAATVTVSVAVDPIATPGLHELNGTLFGVPFSVSAESPTAPLTLTMAGLCTQAGLDTGGLLFEYSVNHEITNCVTLSAWLPDPPLETRLPPYYNPNLEVAP